MPAEEIIRWAAAAAVCLFLAIAPAAGAGGSAGPVWAATPAPADAPREAAHVRIVDYGDDFAWDYFAHGDFYRGKSPSQYPVIGPLDIDDDGERDDCIAYYPFSLEEPLNPVFPVWDLEATNAVFYGGFKGYFANTTRSMFSEMCTNVDHPGDNLTMMVQNWRQPFRIHGLWLWKKQDFLNRGATERVSFDPGSRIGLHLARYSTGAFGRFVVRDGEQFYISEKKFRGAGKQFVETGEGDNSSGYTHKLRPAEGRWAQYNPTPPHHIEFDADAAEFRPHRFTDVTAVGYYFAKDELSVGDNWLKLYAFEVSGVVHRPERASELLAMRRVPAGSTGIGGKTVDVPAFFVGRTEVPYVAWRKIQRWGASPMFAFGWHYTFASTGDMGSMDARPVGGKAEGQAYSGHEPATDIAFLDAAAWCNALSEREGREPCYYADAGFTMPFRKTVERVFDRRTNARYSPRVYVKWSADGYRLPTPAEWLRSAEGVDRDAAASAPRTHRVRDGDLLGNVWEWVWDAGDTFGDDAATKAEAGLVMGGGYTEQPDGSSIGFRVVRREAGASAPPIEAELVPSIDIPWRKRLTEESRTDAASEPDGLAFDPGIRMAAVAGGTFLRHDDAEVTISPLNAAVTEITYRQWAKVRDWAEQRGYRFNFDGDMGSMAYRAGEQEHKPDEPVTRVTGYDMMAWCNALSELHGRRPCYYADEQRTRVYRVSLPYRETMLFNGPWDQSLGVGDVTMDEPVYCDWSADGYRLPTTAEWTYLCLGGGRGPYAWGDAFRALSEHAWCRTNSGGTTHSVATKPANAFGLHDMAGNVMERVWDGGAPGPYDIRNPKGGHSMYRSTHVMGGSFKHADASYFQAHPDADCPLRFGYPEIGFRVVRCAANVHPADGVEDVEIVLLDVQPETPFDPLQGRTFRANLQRTGAYEGPGVETLTGLRWKFQTGGPVRCSPVVVDRIVYIGSDDGHLYALEADTGRKIWSFATGGKVTATPTVVGGRVFCGSKDGILYALDARTGEKLWQYTVDGAKAITDSPIVAHGAVLTTIYGWGTKTGLHAIDIESGEKIAHYRGSPSIRGPYAAALWRNRVVYPGAGSQGIHLPTVNLRSGEVGKVQLNRVKGTAALVGDWAVGAGMCVAAVDLTRPEQRERYCHWLEGEGYTHETTNLEESRSSVAVADGVMYFGNETGHFYAYTVEEGRRQWKVRADGKLRSPPSIAGDLVYFGSDRGTLYALRRRDGAQAWSYRTDGPIVSSPAIRDGVLFVGSDDGAVYALH